MQELKNVKILCYFDACNGPLKGLCSYKEKIYLYSITDDEYKIIDKIREEYEDGIDKFDEGYEIPRKYNVVELEGWQLCYELYWKALFSTNVVTFTDFEKSLVNERFKRKDYHEIREQEYQSINYSNNKIIGYFELKYE